MSGNMIDEAVVKRDRKIYLGLLVAMVALIVYLSLTLKDMTIEAQSLRDTLDTERIVAALAVPSEAIYYDEVTARAIVEQRQRLYLERGTETILPYAAIVHPGGTAGELPAVVPSRALPTNDARALLAGSFESYWHARSWSICEKLRHGVDNDEGTGKWLKEHRGQYEARVRPLVERMLDAYHPMPRRSACRLLIAMGDATPRVRATLEALLSDAGLNAADKKDLRSLIDETSWE